MDRRRFVASGSALALAGLARGAVAADVPRVSLFWPSSPASERHIAALREGLKAQGFAEPARVRIDRHAMVDSYEKLEASARRLAEQRAGVVVTLGSSAAVAAKEWLPTFPVVMVIGSDPVQQGFAQSYARPGGNMTGVALVSSETGAKRVELLKRLAPKVNRVALLYNEGSAAETRSMGGMVESARSIGLLAEPAPVRVEEDIDRAVDKAAHEGAEAFAVVASTMLVAHARRVVDRIAKTKLPAVYPTADYVEVGGVISYGPNLPEAFRMASGYVARILKGSRPAEMPIEQYSRQETVVNVAGAKAIGLTVPPSLLGLADRLIGT